MTGVKMNPLWLKNEEGRFHDTTITSRKIEVQKIAAIFSVVPASMRINDVVLGCDEQGLSKVTAGQLRRVLTYPRDGKQRISAAIVTGDFSAEKPKEEEEDVANSEPRLLTAYQLLSMSLPYLQYVPDDIRKNESKKNVAVKGRRPKTVSVWTSFFDDVVHFCQGLNVKNARFLETLTTDSPTIQRQEDVTLSLAAHVYSAVNNWARVTFPETPVQLRTNHGDSPCLVDHCGEMSSHFLFPVECEGAWKCNFRDSRDERANLNLISSWGGENPSQVIKYLYTYMLLCQRPFGVLTTYEETWFFSRLPPTVIREALKKKGGGVKEYHDDGQLFISPAIFSEGARPSVRQAFAYFLQLAASLQHVRLVDDSEAAGQKQEPAASTASKQEPAADSTASKQEQPAADTANEQAPAADTATADVPTDAVKETAQDPPKDTAKEPVKDPPAESSTPAPPAPQPKKEGDSGGRRYMQSRRGRGKPTSGTAREPSKPLSVLKEYNLSEFKLGRLVMSGHGKTAFQAVWAGQPVMLKLLDNYKNPASEQMVRQEETVYNHLANAQGRSVPKLVCCGHIGGEMLYFVATSFEGPLLTNMKLTAQIITSAFQSLSEIHAAGVLHGDVHLGHIVVNKEGTAVKFVDFGSSCIMKQSEEQFRDMKEEETVLYKIFEALY